MELTRLIHHHLDGVLVLVELVPLALLASARSPWASLDNSHLLGAILVVVTLVLPLAMAITVVMSAFECQLGLTRSQHRFRVLHPCGGVG
jgi:hypothetical protein